jgi:murein DD-endopeptidase
MAASGPQGAKAADRNREVRMRGTSNLHSTVRRLLAVSVAAASLGITVSPVSAHEPRNHLRARRHVKERAMSQIGKPYRYGSESPRRGFDCSGLSYWTFKNHGDPDIARTSIDQWRMRRKRAYKRVWKRRHLEIGDLVFFKTSRAPVGHLGIYIGRKRFVHSSSSGNGVRTDSLSNNSYYRSRYVGAVRVPALQGS